MRGPSVRLGGEGPKGGRYHLYIGNDPSRVRPSSGSIEAVTANRPRRHWLAAFDAQDIPCGPINNYAQVFADPHVVAREMVVDVQHPTLGPMHALGSPIKMSATRPDVRRTAPQLGEHTEEVLREAGFSAEDVAAMQRRTPAAR